VNPEISSTDRLVDRLGRATALDPVADAIQPLVAKTLDGTGPFAPLKDLLHGKPLGHSLHVAMTDVPIGAWTMAAVFDILELCGRTEFAAAADVSIGVGLAGGVGAIVTGLAEWADTKDEPKRLGLAHALTNDVAFAMYSLSFALRRAGKRGAAIGSAFAGYAAVSFGAYLGGELSLGHQLGVKHTVTPIELSRDFVAVLADSELGDEPKTAMLDGVPLLLSRSGGGDVAAISAVCTHRGAPLGDGSFSEGCVTCPWHAARFDLATGHVLEGPAVFPLARFETRIVAGQIEARRAF
jgi:nitrite reductase/ring-hydroxylating ferredoxin subunit/uncharacterized membrane protein